ncbi:hypothetical protein C4D60_Mb04t05580 [Musa balbisiana]|uniref:DM2 domain-containing protein n=1 Tax=Musa balbisiana TaxID=52838 RepID=A0A4S8K9V5_MUSBA|nr:hypothetical protein C4D60_Mb04t05580 [Musa balbisiana]
MSSAIRDPNSRPEIEQEKKRSCRAPPPFMVPCLKSCREISASLVLMAAAKAGVKVEAPAPKAAGKMNTGILKPLRVSRAMEKFVGASEISRPGAIKKIWEHIKLNQLQNPSNKREIKCDTKLKSIFDGRDKVGMFEISKLISPHFLKPN